MAHTRNMKNPTLNLALPIGIAVASAAIGMVLSPRSASQPRLGDYLRASRKATGMTLRAVQAKTAITNGYLSQIESNTVERPSPNVLFKLADAYGIEYSDLLARAGHRVPSSSVSDRPSVLAGIPLRALEELTEDEASDLRNYLAFIQQKRKGA
jgi:transcriptional regulator with XRE-family HTH domain